MEFRPYSKAQQLAGHQKKEKDTPKHKEQRYKKKKKKNPLKQEMYKGRRIPTKQQRGKITTKEYNEALRVHGEECFFCGITFNLECHHVVPKGFSKHKNGRGVWYNLRFLCSECHRGKNGVHQNKEKKEYLQKVHEALYGPHFYQDRFDLFKLGLIPNTSREAYDSFMEEERLKCQDTGKADQNQ